MTVLSQLPNGKNSNNIKIFPEWTTYLAEYLQTRQTEKEREKGILKDLQKWKTESESKKDREA